MFVKGNLINVIKKIMFSLRFAEIKCFIKAFLN